VKNARGGKGGAQCQHGLSPCVLARLGGPVLHVAHLRINKGSTAESDGDRSKKPRLAIPYCAAHAAGVSKVSVLGLVIQFSSEMCEALRLCLAQLLMCNMKLHQFEVLRMMSSACVLFLSVGVYSLEWKRFCQMRAWLRVMEHPHWYLAAGMYLLRPDSFGQCIECVLSAALQDSTC
jgi:hypothetical protein